MRNKRGYYYNNEPLSKSLNEQILKLAPPHVAVSDAPNTYKDLVQHGYNDLRQLRVYNGNSSNTIYGSDEVNYAFRAWHDSIHIEYKLDFKPENEILVAKIQAMAIDGEYEKRLIYADVVSQVEYYNKYKDFVPNQRECVLNYLSKGGR